MVNMDKDNLDDHLSKDSESFLAAGAERQRQIRLVQTFRAGEVLFGIFEDQISTIAEWRQPTPLPDASSAVLGVVSIHGRMLTVLDPTQLLSDSINQDGLAWTSIVALRGDEQLALAIESNAGELEIPSSGLEPTAARGGPVVGGLLRLDDQVINVIEVKELFSTAMRGRERRRRRF